MNDKDIKTWYRTHGMEYIAEDWGPRSDTGESTVAPRARALRVGREEVWSWLSVPDDAEIAGAEQRTVEERGYIEKLEAFFAPYIAMLPAHKGEVLRELINDRKTYGEIREDHKYPHRSSAQRAVELATRALVRLIAQDDPEFMRQPRSRDLELEREAAERVFDRYLRREGK